MHLTELVGELGVDQFYSNYWDLRPVVQHGSADKFKRYYSIDAFESRLTETDIRFPQFQLALDGKPIPKSQYTRKRTVGNHLFEDLIDIPSVYGLWNEGATIILHALHSNCPALISPLRKLENDLGHPLQANAYLTPKNSHGFHIHYDTHDVFALQVEGKKHWRVWADRAERIPLKHEQSPRYDGFEPEGELYFDGVLEEGSLLYMPRGYYHQAWSEGETSLHLTIGVLVYRRIDALKFLFQSVLCELEQSGAETWRGSLAAGYREGGDPEFEAHRAAIMETLSRSWGVQATVNQFGSQHGATNQQLFGRSATIEHMDLSTGLALERNLEPVIRYTDSEIELTYGGRLLRLPKAAESALLTIVRSSAFTPDDLTGYTPKTRLDLCKHLVRQGLIRLTMEPDGTT